MQRMMSTRSIKKADGKNYGKSQAKSVWVKKARCTCNHAMNRRVTYVAKNGDKSFIYQCYHQLQTGTKAARIKKGLSIDNICENTTFTESVIRSKRLRSRVVMTMGYFIVKGDRSGIIGRDNFEFS